MTSDPLFFFFFLNTSIVVSRRVRQTETVCLYERQTWNQEPDETLDGIDGRDGVKDIESSLHRGTSTGEVRGDEPAKIPTESL